MYKFFFGIFFVDNWFLEFFMLMYSFCKYFHDESINYLSVKQLFMNTFLYIKINKVYPS